MSSRQIRAVIVVSIYLFVAIEVLTAMPGLAASSPAITTGSQRRQVEIPVRNFSLTDQTGHRFQFQKIKGRVTLMAFGYTTCPDVCPLITAAMRQVQADLNPTERDTVYFITVTTDPEVDEPKVLASYARRYGADLSNWAFLTGDEQSLGHVWKNFGVRVHRKSRGLIDHTALTAVIDQTGTIRLGYYGTSPDPKAIVQDMRALLSRR